jgi:hypothetical protein
MRAFLLILLAAAAAAAAGCRTNPETLPPVRYSQAP